MKHQKFTKVCTVCQIEKPLEDYSVGSGACKPCKSAKTLKYHRERMADTEQNCRAFDPSTKQYLHMSGQGLTKGDVYAWRGSPAQFRALCELNPDAKALQLRRI